MIQKRPTFAQNRYVYHQKVPRFLLFVNILYHFMYLCPHCFSISSENPNISVMSYCKAVWKIYLLKLILKSNRNKFNLNSALIDYFTLKAAFCI